jgi:hypothetical protein
MAVCPCPQCRIRSLVGPFVLITIGVLFSLDHIFNRWSFGDTWPVILIVIGLVKMIERLASSEGHGGYFSAPPQTGLGPTGLGETGEKTDAT